MPLFRLSEDLIFPPPHLALDDGLLAIGGDLSVDRLLLAYRMGIFPWYTENDPILWWSPDPRMVMTPTQLHVSRRLEREIKAGTFTVTMDTAFADVIRACAEVRGPQRNGTWIVPEMERAYIALHVAGYAHSVECWKDGALAGGLYGVSQGACFFGESMFSKESNASKVAFTSLVRQLGAWAFRLVDCQMHTPHLERLGAREVSRARFLRMLQDGLAAETRRGAWSFDGATG
ncbi:MAG: leucyl/phenylalanyl-tRNA--protein transferase [Candidatus Hydrogenedentes bacterium]|nr:leucyl/phenylalanyl-tRNA--protein transferase [Candidatus Hydrogenedentota bacterium]